MDIKMQISSLVFLVFFIYSTCDLAKSNTTETIKCYQCNSKSVGEEECINGDENALKKYIKECLPLTEGKFAGNRANSCRKILKNVEDNKSTVRECAYTGNETIHGKHRTGSKGISLYLYQCFNTDNEKPCNAALPLYNGQTIFISFAFFISFIYVKFFL